MKLRAARHYQREDDAALRISRAAQPKVARDLSRAFRMLGEMVPAKQIAEAMRGRGPGGLRHPEQHINWHHYREALKGAFGRIADAYQQGAELGERKINGSFHAAGRRVRYRKVSRFTFDSLDEDVQAKLREDQDRLIRQLEIDARDTIDTVIMDGARNGTSIDEIASDIRETIGLTDVQAQAVLNYQRMLQDLDPDALERQLRNSEYDSFVQDAIDAGEDLAQTAIDRMVGDYIENYLDYRAEAIARTETTRAVSQGLHDAYSQAIARGALTDDAVRRFWQLGPDPCPICKSVPDANPEGVGVDEEFDSDDGSVDDPPVHPHCECTVDYVTDLSKMPDEEGGDGNDDVEAFDVETERS